MMRVLKSQSDRDREEVVHGLAFAPSGDRLAVSIGLGGGERTAGRVEVVGLVPGLEPGHLLHDRSSARSVAFSPDGRMIAAGLGDRTIRIWDSTALAEVRVLTGQTWPANCLAFSPDGSTLASGAAEEDEPADLDPDYRLGELAIWDVESGSNRLRYFETRVVRSLAFSIDGRTVAFGSVSVPFPETTTLRHGDEFGASMPVRGLVCLLGGERLASASGEEILVWDMRALEEIARVCGLEWPIWALAASPDTRSLASGSIDGKVHFWDIGAISGRALLGLDLESLGERVRFPSGLRSVHALAYSPDGSTLAVGGRGDHPLILWDLE